MPRATSNFTARFLLLGVFAGTFVYAQPVVEVDGAEQAAKLKTHSRPSIPALAAQANVQGPVRFLATIDKAGRVVNAQLLQGHPLLAHAAHEAVLKWEYAPTVRNGVPVMVRTTIAVDFEGGVPAAPARPKLVPGEYVCPGTLVHVQARQAVLGTPGATTPFTRLPDITVKQMARIARTDDTGDWFQTADSRDFYYQIASGAGSSASCPEQAAESGSGGPAPQIPGSRQAGGRFHKWMESAKSTIQQGVKTGSAPNGPFVVDQLNLRNILPQYDPQTPLSKQFPHVAVTVLKSPAMWADYHQGFSGCWTLQVVVWSDENTSKRAGPFEWCAPRDEQWVPAPGYHRNMDPMPRLIDYDYTTGIRRTEGPRPPNGVFPNDRETLSLRAQNSSNHGAMELKLDGSSRFAMMFMNLRLAMGQSLADEDRRVWIVSIK